MTYQNNKIEFIKIQGASFIMGSTDTEIERCVQFWKNRLVDTKFTEEKFRSWIHKEHPAFTINISPFQLSKYPITNGIYRIFCLKTRYLLAPSLVQGFPDDHPVWGVTPEDIKNFTDFLFKTTGLKFRMPSEAEWEYAARGSARLEYPYGNDFNPQFANTIESGIGTTTPVDSYENHPSPFGVVDMAGNTEEWVADYYKPYPGGCLIYDHLLENLGPQYRILRGGSFARGGDLSRGARRHGPFPSPLYQNTSFRLVFSEDKFEQNSCLSISI